MDNEQKIEELQNITSELLSGLNAKSLSLDWFYFFEDRVQNKEFDLAHDLLKDKDHKNMNEYDRKALLFIFEHASAAYKLLYNNFEDRIDLEDYEIPFT